MGVGRRADFLHQLGQPGFRLAFLVVAIKRPLRVVDVIEQMHDVPAFAGLDRGDF